MQKEREIEGERSKETGIEQWVGWAWRGENVMLFFSMMMMMMMMMMMRMMMMVMMMIVTALSIEFLLILIFIVIDVINYYINIVGCKTFQHHWPNLVSIFDKTRMTRLGPVLESIL